MKKIILSLALSISFLIVNAQSPEKINYQAVARDASGNPLVNQTLNVTYQIRQSSPTGTSVYTETHSGISTNQFGLFTAEIGGGTPSVGTFAGINWGAGLYYLYVEVNGDPIGSSQLLSVPYALHAKTATSGVPGTDGYNSLIDTSAAGSSCPNGGYQVLIGLDSNANGTLESIEISKTFVICNGIDGTSGTTYFTGSGISLSGDTITNLGDADADPSNELQDLSLTGNSLSLTNDPTPVDLSPFMDNTDAQTLSINANTLAISNGNSVTLPAAPTYTAGTGINLAGNVITNTAPDQTVALTNGTGINVTGTYPNFTINNTSPASGINITGGGITNVTSTPPNFTISTPAQTLTYTAPNLTLSNGGGTVTIPPSPWGKTGTTIHELNAGDNVGIGITNAEGSLHVRSTSTQLKLGHPNQPTAEWAYGVNASGLLSVINENYGTPVTVMSMTNLGLVGVGTTAPTANLHLDGTLRLNNLGGSTPAIGSVLTSIDAQGNAEWQPPIITTTYWSPNGTDIYNNNSGNVGIGTSSPNVALHIQGTNTSTTLNAYGGSPETALRLFNTDITPNNFSSIAFTTMLSNSASAEMGKIAVQNVNHTIGSVQGDMVFMTRNSSNLNEVMRVTGNGNVGIATTSPTRQLHVTGTTLLAGVTEIGSAAALSAQFKVTNAGNFGLSMFVSGGTGTQMSVLNNGNVNIGNPTTNITRLFVQDNNTSTDGSGNSYLSLQNSANSNNISTGVRFRVGGTFAPNGDYHYKGAIFFRNSGGTNGEGDMIFAVNNTASSGNVGIADATMTISSATNVGIGTTIPNSKLHVNETSTNPGFRVQINGITSFIVANNGNVALNNNAAPGFMLHLSANDAAKPTSNVWTVPSDKNLKKDIKPFTGGLADVLKINPVWFTYNGKAGMPDDTGVGIIAQELQKVAPFMVNEWKYQATNQETGELEGEVETYLCVDNGAMTYMLINAIKEQQKMIEELQKEIQELKNK